MLKRDFIDKLKTIHKDLSNYDFSGVPESFDYHSKISYRCLKHDLELSRLPANFKTGICPQCSLEKRSKTLRQSLDQIRRIDKFKDYVFLVEEEELDKPFKIKDPIQIKCPSGHIYTSTLNKTISSESGCPYCANNVRHTLETLAVKIEKKFPNKLLYLEGEYENQRSKLLFRCRDCGHEQWYTSNQILSSPHGCTACANRALGDLKRKPANVYIEEVSRLHEGKYDYSLVDYRGASRHITVICPDHGAFSIRAGDHLHNRGGCPRCSYKRSREEIELHKWLSLTFSLEGLESDYRPSWMKLYGSPFPSELDIFIPELRLAIEYNGTYWHSEESLLTRGKPDYHLAKYLRCKENGVDLIHIFEFENMVKWKKKLSNIIRNRDGYDISFSNEMRGIGALSVLGKTLIHKI